ncbi:MAG: putative enzyme of poly-gamma-glutamate biosynthesis (capsule formation)-like protein [Bryobacterales bacterium]|nr:putative enzyme of poly-gamma-glutamate biosynthesis (capsule formation)-like protein [Bryobacterales bacterium]
MKLTRRKILSRAGLPLLGVLPFSRTAEQPAPDPVRTRLLLGGDVMLSRHVGRLARGRRDPAFPLRDLAPLLQAADIAFVNLESPFSDRGAVVERGMIFKAEPEMIAALELAGVDVVSTANNHARDQGSYGVEFTLDWLQGHQIAVAGTGKSAEAAHAGVVIERNGLRFGFLAYTYDQSNGNHPDTDDRVAVMDMPRMREDVARLALSADAIIVSMHAGIEYSPKSNAQQVAFAQAAIDTGARVVVGHHPHVTQPWERYGDGVIFYSLGNLVFDQFQRVETQHGALADIVFEGPRLARASLLPVDIVGTAPRLTRTTIVDGSSGASAAK